MQLGQEAESLVVVARVAHLRRHLNLVLHFLVVVHDVDGEDALRLDGLAVGTITRAINHDLGLDGLHHRLPHHHARLLNASHVHGGHSTSGALAIHHELLLVELALALTVVVSLVRTTRLSVDDGGLPKHLGVAHLGHADLLDEAAVGVVWHCHLLWVHVLLLVLGFVLIHLLAAIVLRRPTLVDGLAKLKHAVSVCAVVLVWASFSRVKVLADHRLVVLEPLTACTTRITTLTSTILVTTWTTSATATTCLSTNVLEVLVSISTSTIHAATHTSATALTHAASATATTHTAV